MSPRNAEPKRRRKPSQERARVTVDAILEGAARVFDREGLDATTNRIAAEAGVSIGSLYEYFANKQALLEALGERHLETARASITALGERWLETAPGAEALADELTALVLDAHARHPSTHTLLTDLARRHPRFAREGLALQRLLVSLVHRELARALPASAHPELRARVTVFIVGELVHHMLLPERLVARGEPALLAAHLRELIAGYLSNKTY